MATVGSQWMLSCSSSIPAAASLPSADEATAARACRFPCPDADRCESPRSPTGARAPNFRGRAASMVASRAVDSCGRLHARAHQTAAGGRQQHSSPRQRWRPGTRRMTLARIARSRRARCGCHRRSRRSCAPCALRRWIGRNRGCGECVGGRRSAARRPRSSHSCGWPSSTMRSLLA